MVNLELLGSYTATTGIRASMAPETLMRARHVDEHGRGQTDRPAT